MAYRTEMFRGKAREGVNLINAVSGTELYEVVKETFIEEIKLRNIPAIVREDTLKSGGLFGSRVPILVIKNSEKSCKYFDIGVYVNGSIVNFPLLGESAENTKYNTKKEYEKDGKYFKASFVKPDELKLQQEAMWRQAVLACFDVLVD